MDTQLQNQINRMFPARNWPDIAGNWLTYFPAITPPGSKPSSAVGEFIGFEQVALSLNQSNRQVRRDVDGFREIIFHEAMYLLHKSSHVIGCSETDANIGAHTWSLAQAYQGAFFAAKAISYLLGGFIAEHDRDGILVDLWPGLYSGTSRIGLLPDSTIAFWLYKRAPGHMHMWQLFQHLVRVTRVSIWPSEYVSLITALAPHEFAKQRNIIHYEGGSWIFDDLFDFKPNNTYGVIKDRFLSGISYDEHSDFTFVIAQIIFRMGLLILGDIKSLTNKIEPEIEILSKRLNMDFHPYYSKEFPQ
jgi:hypothetical protein